MDHNIWLWNGNYISKLVHQDQSCYSCFVLLIHFFFIVISAFSLLYWRFHCYIGVFNCCSNIYVPFVLVIPFVFLLNVQCKTEFNIRRILFLSKLSVKSLAKSFGLKKLLQKLFLQPTMLFCNLTARENFCMKSSFRFLVLALLLHFFQVLVLLNILINFLLFFTCFSWFFNLLYLFLLFLSFVLVSFL